MEDSCRYLTIMEKTGRNMRLNEKFCIIFAEIIETK